MSVTELEQLIVAGGTRAEDLRAEADHIREATVGDEVHLRAIIEFSSYCRCNCDYCGLRADNEKLTRYRLRPAEILQAAIVAESLNFGTVVLQSGEDEGWTAEGLAEAVADVKARTHLAVTLSVGERDEWEYRLWREAGADRYLLKHETADRDLYERLHPGASFDHRLRCLELLGEIGYQIGSGCIVGLPGQTPAILAQDLLLMQRLNLHMAGIGPLIPHPDTPLAGMPIGEAEVVLNMMALTRLLIPDIMLASTTALETAMDGGRLAGLKSGGNVLMPNLTPRDYASFYEIYPGKKAPHLEIVEEVERAHRVIAAAGRVVGKGQGHSPRAATKVTV